MIFVKDQGLRRKDEKEYGINERPEGNVENNERPLLSDSRRPDRNNIV